ILERLAGRVRARRQDLSLTLKELGQEAGVSERFLVLLAGGRANVSVTKLEDIARALHTSAADLLSERPFEPPPPSVRSQAARPLASGPRWPAQWWRSSVCAAQASPGSGLPRRGGWGCPSPSSTSGPPSAPGSAWPSSSSCTASPTTGA